MAFRRKSEHANGGLLAATLPDCTFLSPGFEVDCFETGRLHANAALACSGGTLGAINLDVVET